MLQRNAQRGFTLVEIAIVMVIIGLLLGGALKGQEMIENAKVKSLLRFHDEVKAAYYSYQDIYRAYPGDDKDANRLDDVSDTQVGTGDGVVEGNWRSSNDKDESILMWRHLISAGLLGIPMPEASSQTWGLGAKIPTNIFGGVAGFEYTNELKMPVLCFNNLSEEQAVKIDLAADDGDLMEGTVFATNMGAADTLKELGRDYAQNNSALCFAF